MLGLVLFLAVAGPLEREPAYREARASYEAFEFEEARARFEALERRRDLTPPEKARLRLWIGMCHAEEGALAAAADDFEAAATLDPDVAPLDVMSPKARRILEEARARALKRRPARRPPPLPDPEPEPDPDPEPTPATPSSTTTSIPPLAVAGGTILGVSGVALAGGLIAGGAAAGAAADAAALTGAAEATARHRQAEQLATGANVGFVVAGVAAVVGAGLLLAGVTAGD